MEYEIEKLGYNPARAESIERYAQGLIGLTIREAVGEYAVEAKRNKGNLGQLIEKGFFGYENNNESLPDFYEAGVELKLTPFKKNKNNTYSAKERLIITMIDYMKVINEENLYTSHLWTKASKILLVEYLYKKDIKDTLDYKIKYATLFSPQREDLPTIEADYHIIVSKVQAGKAHELSEGPISMIDEYDKPARTMLTSEGSFNRSTHIVRDKRTGKIRLLTPIEAERIQGFPDDWTKECLVNGEAVEMPLNKRRFMMGNALVVNLIEQMERQLSDIFDNE